jgi:small-conductance mechanosensitive channel
MFGLNTTAIMAAVITAMVAAMAGYVWFSNEQIKKLSSEVAVAQTQVKIQEATIADIKRQSALQQRAVETLQGKMNEAENKQAHIMNHIRQINIQASATKDRAATEHSVNTDLDNAFKALNPGGPHAKK